MLSTYDTRTKSSKPHTQDSIPSFIRKTYDILDEGKHPDIIDWNAEGTALVIKKPSEFCQKVLPQYFKHNNLTSFVRQLNMYNFHKRRTQNIDHVYYHELFQRGKKHLLKEIRRKNHENNNSNNHMDKYSRPMETLDHNQHNKETNSILCENQFLKRLYNDAMSKIAIFENQIQELTAQNNSLRSQLYQPGEPVPQHWGYKSVPASLEVQSSALPKEEPAMDIQQDLSIPPLKLSNAVTMVAPVTSMTSYFTAEDSTEPTEASHNSPNQGTESEMKTEFVSEQMPSLTLNVAPQESQANGVKINGLRISRGDTSIGRLFESWNAQNTELNESTVLGKRDLNVEKGVSQFDFAEPAMKRNEMALYAKKSLISNGIEDKELMRIFAQRGISNEDFGIDLMNFSN